jgi:hypothetical protein
LDDDAGLGGVEFADDRLRATAFGAEIDFNRWQGWRGLGMGRLVAGGKN